VSDEKECNCGAKDHIAALEAELEKHRSWPVMRDVKVTTLVTALVILCFAIAWGIGGDKGVGVLVGFVILWTTIFFGIQGWKALMSGDL
jgi:divalent metal cation (Fe/Co/Zn/Cd) transporter